MDDAHSSAISEVAPDSGIAHDDRREMVAGLRQLADALEANPDMPAPWGSITLFAAHVKRDGESEIEVMARAVKAIPGRVDKGALGDSYFSLSRNFAGLRYELLAGREEVCTRRQVGEREVIKVVPVSDDTEEITTLEPVYEWDCDPVLRAS